ncbi:DNA alkylation repair protein [Pseudoduganella ginsengisoli]|uniref:DNA alkylation repair protein n=1 Tax=Pseudoduganella ginsengisoli TaxID=1462440 RepID=A0A6L6Q4R2_9BURK|nr:DNA alkylation repair protein [Pseudoduganella ginsengisoli]MTW04248.1 DNA alkylation repair protein [Pseudoduganella ginsengisoli]
MDHPIITEIRSALLPLADSERAPAMRAYMRDRFIFLGIATPARRAAIKPIIRQISEPQLVLPLAQALWTSPEREYHYAALDMLALHWKKLHADDIPRLITLARTHAWWDSVDGMAGIIGDVLRHRHDYMDEALASSDFWVRRIALLHQLGWRGKTDETRLFNYCKALAHEKEFFIQKAIGWALRDYARHAPDRVREFTAINKDILAALSYREANKHL